MEILPTARKHRVSDEDIARAIEHALLYLGPDQAGNMLEVVSIVRDDDRELVIHAMRMRPMYEPFLRGKEEIDG